MAAALALPALALPVVSLAETPAELTATHQCAQQLGQRLGVPVASTHFQPSRFSPLQIYVRPARQLRLQVYDARTGALVANGVCQYDRNGNVVSVTPEPAHSMDFDLTGATPVG
jgi:hypothetical protein